MIYFDNAATTKLDKRVLDKMIPYFTDYYGNANSKYYDLAEKSKQAILVAKMQIADLIGCEVDEVYFNSGATEGNNHVLKGICDLNKNLKKPHIITSKIEHSSIIDTCKYLETNGIEVTYLDVNSKGLINIEDLENEIKENTILCSIGYVNSEIGTIQDLEKIIKTCKKNSILLHSDITQAIGKVDFNLSNFIGVTFVTFSSHKIYGPKGIGALIILRDEDNIKIKLPPLIHGGSQDIDYRSGTSPTALIVGFGEAASILKEEISKNIELLKEMDNQLLSKLREYEPGIVQINNNFSSRIPGILNVRFKGFNNQILLKNAKDIFAASSGSACSNTKPSYVLKAIGLNSNEISESIRLSISRDNTLKDIQEFIFKVL